MPDTSTTPQLPTLSILGLMGLLFASNSLPGEITHKKTVRQTGLNNLVNAVVGIDTRIPANARTAPKLETMREDSGVILSEDGLVLAIGYLILKELQIDIILAEGRKLHVAFVAYNHPS